MRYVIVDLEATCWRKGNHAERMEIIEIGAVILPASQATTADIMPFGCKLAACDRRSTSDGAPTQEFVSFVRPIIDPTLSDFCRELTTIRQEEVDAADDFTVVFPQFLAWIGKQPFTLCSWGAYDLKQFKIDCRRHGIPFPTSFQRHINIKKEFARQRKMKQCGMKRALRILKIPLEGQHHRAIADVRNIAKIAQHVLPATAIGT